jgi:hypothetical protein
MFMNVTKDSLADSYLIDVHAGVIVDVAATAAHRTEETNATETMIDRIEEHFDLKPRRLIGDTAYGFAAMLGCLVDSQAKIAGLSSSFSTK